MAEEYEEDYEHADFEEIDADDHTKAIKPSTEAKLPPLAKNMQTIPKCEE